MHVIIHIICGIRMIINIVINARMDCEIHLVNNITTNARMHIVNIINTNPTNYTCKYEPRQYHGRTADGIGRRARTKGGHDWRRARVVVVVTSTLFAAAVAAIHPINDNIGSRAIRMPRARSCGRQ